MTTKIEWAQNPDGTAGETWNPTMGCDRVSPGCDHCYAIGQAHRFVRDDDGPLVTERRDGRIDWDGRIFLHPERLATPLHWRKPRRIFVNSMSDLFHDDVPDEYIARVFAVMAATPQHSYQVLTKRHGRMRSFLRDECRCGSGHANGVHLRSAMDWASTPHSPTYVPGIEPGLYHRIQWPLPNVWIGVSVEDQKRADLRIPALLDTPAAVRFLSCEPLIGPVDLSPWIYGKAWPDTTRGASGVGGQMVTDDPGPIGWVIAGGESGPGCRPMHPEWARDIRDDCMVARVPFFFKQHGGWQPITNLREWVAGARWVLSDGTFEQGSPGAVGFPDGGQRDDGAQLMQLRSKKAAGRVLDGREWSEFPSVAKETA